MRSITKGDERVRDDDFEKILDLVGEVHDALNSDDEEIDVTVNSQKLEEVLLIMTES